MAASFRTIPIRVGFTGTGTFIAPQQRATLERHLRKLKPYILHHGDCVEADAAAHDIAVAHNMAIRVHPPDNPVKRAFKTTGLDTIVLAEAEYHVRNLHIVRAAEHMVGCPDTYEEIVRSGTWSTIRKARKRKIPIFLIFPDGVEMADSRFRNHGYGR
jgi:hypothetical protein